ncbi:MAG: SIS domain-containing protein [Pseudomonadota bacterium]
MINNEFLKTYFSQYKDLAFNTSIHSVIEDFAKTALSVKSHNKKMIFAGNGASASIAEHGAVDFTKQTGVRGITFHDPNLITCFANDFGYDNWLAKAIEHYCDSGDAVVLISVSGRSLSVVNAAKYARDHNMSVIAFTGRDHDNPLALLADINFHVPSHAYNIVENIHGMWMTAAIDLIIGESVYETRAKDVQCA